MLSMWMSLHIFYHLSLLNNYMQTPETTLSDEQCIWLAKSHPQITNQEIRKDIQDAMANLYERKVRIEKQGFRKWEAEDMLKSLQKEIDDHIDKLCGLLKGRALLSPPIDNEKVSGDLSKKKSTGEIMMCRFLCLYEWCRSLFYKKVKDSTLW